MDSASDGSGPDLRMPGDYVWLPGHTLKATDWVELGLEPEDQLSCAATVAWAVPVLLGSGATLDEELFTRTASMAQLLACTRVGLRRRVQTQLDTSSEITDRAYADNVRERENPEAWQNKLARIRLFAADWLLAAPGFPWSAKELSAAVNARGEPCRPEDVLRALQPILPDAADHPNQLSLPAELTLSELLAHEPRAKAAMVLWDLVDGGRNYLRRGGPTRREDGVARDRLRHVLAGIPDELVPVLSSKIAPLVERVLRKYAVDPTDLSLQARKELMLVQGLTVQSRERESVSLEPGRMEALRAQVLRAHAYALSHGGSIHRSRWVLRLGLGWSVRNETTLSLEAAGQRLGRTERGMMDWLDGPRALTQQHRTARGLGDALRTLFGAELYKPGVDPWVDPELLSTLLDFLEPRAAQGFTSLRRIVLYLLRRLPRPISRGALQQTMDLLVQRGVMAFSCLEDGEPAYRVCASGITQVKPGGIEERSINVLRAFRSVFASLLQEEEPGSEVRLDRSAVLLPPDRIEDVFEEVLGELRVLLDSELAPYVDLPRDFDPNFRVILLLTYRQAMARERRRLPMLDRDG